MSYGVQSAGLFGSTSQSDGSSNSLRPFANLDLTEEQRTQIRSIFKTAKTDGSTEAEIQQQILAILTPTQQTTFQSDIAAQSSNAQSQASAPPPPPPGGNPFADPNGPFANLDLTSSQQSQISQILANGKSQGLSLDQINAQIDTVLTSSQQATFTSDLANLPPPPGAQGSGSGVQTAQANVSGQSQTGSGGTSASSTSTLTESDIQNQLAAATSLILQQLQSEVGITS